MGVNHLRLKRGEKGYCVIDVVSGQQNYFSSWKDTLDFIEMIFEISRDDQGNLEEGD